MSRCTRRRGGRASTAPSEPGMPNLYAVIGVDRTASTKEITKAFRRKSVKTHPDKFMGDDSHDQKVKDFQALTEAYNELKDPELRKEYDSTGKTGARAIASPPFPCSGPGRLRLSDSGRCARAQRRSGRTRAAAAAWTTWSRR